MSEVVKHIMHTNADNKGTSWCGRQLFGFNFINIDHAIYNIINEGRLLACKKCINKIIKIMRSQGDG